MGFDDPFAFSAIIFAVMVVIIAFLLALMTKQGLDFSNNRIERIKNACTGLTTLAAPMVVVPLSKLKEFDNMIPHEEARNMGAVTILDTFEQAIQFATKYNIIFISHQWLGWHHPDPNRIQYPMVIDAAESLRTRLEVGADDLYVWLEYLPLGLEPRSLHSSPIDWRLKNPSVAATRASRKPTRAPSAQASTQSPRMLPLRATSLSLHLRRRT